MCDKSAKEARVMLQPYDSSWPEMFKAEKVLLERVLEPWINGPIEHVGSTAISGMIAKPVIDIMVPVRSLAASRSAIPLLAEYDYCYAPYREDVMHWFCKPSPTRRTHHLHLVPYQSVLWVERLAFRDYLRQNNVVSQEYVELKMRAADEYQMDREAYTKAKSAFVQKVLDLAFRPKILVE